LQSLALLAFHAPFALLNNLFQFSPWRAPYLESAGPTVNAVYKYDIFHGLHLLLQGKQKPPRIFPKAAYLFISA
jgi:hypothetical protein